MLAEQIPSKNRHLYRGIAVNLHRVRVHGSFVSQQPCRFRVLQISLSSRSTSPVSTLKVSSTASGVDISTPAALRTGIE